MRPVIYTVETFPKLSESFIWRKAQWLLDAGIPLQVIDKYPFQRESDCFPSELADHFRTVTTALYPGKNRLERFVNRSLMILKAWCYLLPTHPFLLRHYQQLTTPYGGIGGFQGLMRNPQLADTVNVSSKQRIDRFLYLYYALKLKPACVHVHFGFNALDWVPVKQVLGNRLKLIVSFLGRDITVDPKENPHMYRRLFEVGDLFLASSGFLRDEAVALGCPPEKIVVHPVEIDTTFYMPRETPKPETDKLRILSVGRLVWEKDYDTALKTIARVRKLLPDLPFEYGIVGCGPLRESLEDLAVRLQLDDIVVFHGSQPPEAVREKLWQSDVFLQTSASEGLGAAVLEAASCGLPVVCTDAGGLPMTVQHERSGYSLPVGDHDALGHALAEILQNADLRQQMGDTGRQYVTENFDTRLLFPRLLEYYGMSPK